MTEEIFISYRRLGGVETAKLISETLKGKGYSVFFDFDSLQGGQFDQKIFSTIEKCNDFIVILSPGALDLCTNDTDWVRYEIRHALRHGKNIIPVMLPGFDFPKNLPDDIKDLALYNGVPFVMAYYNGVIDTLTNRLVSKLKVKKTQSKEKKSFFHLIFDRKHSISQNGATPEDVPISHEEYTESKGLEFEECSHGYCVTGQGKCQDGCIVIPAKHNGKPVVRIGDNAFSYSSMYKIVIPEGVTKIEHSAFWRCDNLECVILPSSIQDIERCAMLLNNDDWPIVEEIIYKGTKKEWKSVRLGDVWSAPNNVICSDGVAYCNKFRYYDP